MDTNKIDPQLISENLTELLTNSINISSLFEKVFYSPEVNYSIPLEQYVYKDGSLVMEETFIKNIAAIADELKNSSSPFSPENISSIIDDNTIKLNNSNKLYVDGENLSVSAAATATSASAAETIKNALVGSASNLNVWVGTQEEYDSIVKDPSTLYFIKES